MITAFVFLLFTCFDCVVSFAVCLFGFYATPLLCCFFDSILRACCCLQLLYVSQLESKSWFLSGNNMDYISIYTYIHTYIHDKNYILCIYIYIYICISTQRFFQEVCGSVKRGMLLHIPNHPSQSAGKVKEVV